MSARRLELERRVACEQQVLRLLESIEASIGFRESVLQDALQAYLRIALRDSASVVLIGGAFGGPVGELDEDLSEGEGGGNERAAGEGLEK